MPARPAASRLTFWAAVIPALIAALAALALHFLSGRAAEVDAIRAEVHVLRDRMDAVEKWQARSEGWRAARRERNREGVSGGE